MDSDESPRRSAQDSVDDRPQPLGRRQALQTCVVRTLTSTEQQGLMSAEQQGRLS